MKRTLTLSFLLLMALLATAACGGTTAPAANPTTSDTPPPTTEPQRPTPTTEPRTSDSYPAPAQPAQTADTTAEGYPPPPAAPAISTAADQASYPAPSTAASSVSASEPRTFTIVPAQSEAAYVVAETFLENALSSLNIPAGLVDTIGRTQTVEGELVLDLSQANPIVSSFFQVDLSTLTSDQSRRDNRLKQDWLESTRYPLATFVATGVEDFPANYTEGESATFKLLGDLTIRTTTLPVVFEVTATLANGQITGTAVAPLTMSDFGVRPPSMLGLFSVEDAFRVELSFTAEEQ